MNSERAEWRMQNRSALELVTFCGSAPPSGTWLESETRNPEPLRISNHDSVPEHRQSRCLVTQSLQQLTRSLWLSHHTAVPWALYCTSIPDSRP